MKFRTKRKQYRGEAVVPDYRLYLSDRELILRTVSFILATQLLGQYARAISRESDLE
jgi:hypothetical protein